jgi:hypothetical protein
MVPNSNVLDSKRSGHGARATEDNLLGNSQGLLIGSLSF